METASPVSPSLLDELKRGTREQHEKIEQLAGLPGSRADYVWQLSAFLGYVEPWERRLSASLPAADPIVAGRLKTGWLLEDLRTLGLGEAEIAAIPRAGALPEITSRARALGAAYVLEGSTLGGQILSRHVTRTLGLTDGNGCRYFGSYGSRVGMQWQLFRDELMKASAPDTDREIIEAAQEMFACLHTWFVERRQAADR